MPPDDYGGRPATINLGGYTRLKPLLIKLLKFGISAAIIAYLVIDARNDATFADLASKPKHWGLLAGAWAFCMAGVVVTIVRWYFLVRALDLPFTLRDAFRLGFLGYLFNFISLGSVGGDLFKAVFLAREHPQRRAEAVATVIVDRIIGLYALFVVASFFILIFGQMQAPAEQIRVICRGTLIGTLIGTVGLVVVFMPGFTRGKFATYLSHLPRAGHILRKLLWAVRIYREKPAVMVLVGLLSLAVHVLFTIGIYLTARGLPGTAPSLADHFIIVPLAMVAGALPLPLNGLGAFEGVVEFLYRHVPTGVVILPGEGLLVSLGYRAITIVIALVGVCFYLGHRREVGEVLQTAEAEEAADEAAFDNPELLKAESAQG